MKFTATFKWPDPINFSSDIDKDVHQEMIEFASKWIKYGEYITVEFDTDAVTCTVKEK